MKEIEVKYQCGYRGAGNELFDSEIAAKLSLYERELYNLHYEIVDKIDTNVYNRKHSRDRKITYDVATTFIAQAGDWITLAKKAVELEEHIRYLKRLLDMETIANADDGVLELVLDLDLEQKPKGLFRRLRKALGL